MNFLAFYRMNLIITVNKYPNLLLPSSYQPKQKLNYFVLSRKMSLFVQFETKSFEKSMLLRSNCDSKSLSTGFESLSDYTTDYPFFWFFFWSGILREFRKKQPYITKLRHHTNSHGFGEKLLALKRVFGLIFQICAGRILRLYDAFQNFG